MADPQQPPEDENKGEKPVDKSMWIGVGVACAVVFAAMMYMLVSGYRKNSKSDVIPNPLATTSDA